MQQRHTVNNLEIRGGGYRTAFSFVKVDYDARPRKSSSEQHSSPLSFRTSSIQQAKKRLRSSQSLTTYKSQFLHRKTSEAFISKQGKVWPFTSGTPEHDYSRNIDSLLRNNTQLKETFNEKLTSITRSNSRSKTHRDSAQFKVKVLTFGRL